ncbi:hypothetical protein ACFLVK_02410, partial [Chloroflexota bacterium]
EGEQVVVPQGVTTTPTMSERSGPIPHLLTCRAGITLVMITHDANIARHCQRIIHLKDGQVVSGETT